MKRKRILLEYLKNNKRVYIIMALMFVIGVIIGVIFINCSGEEKTKQLSEYVNSLVENIKKTENLENSNKFIDCILKNCKIIIGIFILGCCFIGSYLIYFIIIYKGFKIGYAVSTFIYVLGSKKGIIFSLSSLLLQNIVFIPVMFLMAEFGIKFYKNVEKNRGRIKSNLLKNIIVLIICLIVSIIASFIEVYVSTKVLKVFKEIF